MSGKWERTYELSVPVERVWHAMTDPDELRQALEPPPGADRDFHERRLTRMTRELVEAEPLKRLRWVQECQDPVERAEFTVVFESTETGSRFTVTRASFGEGDEADIFAESNALGVGHGFMDLVFYLETGCRVRRHYAGSHKSATGMVYTETDAGVEVRVVSPTGFGADAGLRRGDLLVRMAGAAIYDRADIWQIADSRDPGTMLEVEYVRDGELRTSSAQMAPISMAMVGE